MEALRSSETAILTRATPLNITEDGVLHSYGREISSLTSIHSFTGWQPTKVDGKASWKPFAPIQWTTVIEGVDDNSFIYRVIDNTEKGNLYKSCGALRSCETSRIPHFLDCWHKIGGMAGSFKFRPHFTFPFPIEDSYTHFC
jgi:hypothetical protein